MLTGCTFCDTIYARNGEGGREMTIEEVAEEAHRLEPHYRGWVCITGGEPLYQIEGVHELIKLLKKMYGHRIEVETNGSIPPPPWYTIVDSWVADMKCPSSGVSSVSKVEWFDTRFCDQIKFVVGTQEDLDFAERLILRYMAKNPIILVSPVVDPVGDASLNKAWLQEVAEFCKGERVRLSLQLHKIIWGNKKGV